METTKEPLGIRTVLAQKSSHQERSSPGSRGVDRRWGMGAFVAEAPSLLLRHFFGPAKRGFAVAAPVASRFNSRLAQDARGDARRRKIGNSPAARPRPRVVSAGCRRWCVFVTNEGSSTTQSPGPGAMPTVTRRRRRRRYAARDPSS